MDKNLSPPCAGNKECKSFIFPSMYSQYEFHCSGSSLFYLGFISVGQHVLKEDSTDMAPSGNIHWFSVPTQICWIGSSGKGPRNGCDSKISRWCTLNFGNSFLMSSPGWGSWVVLSSVQSTEASADTISLLLLTQSQFWQLLDWVYLLCARYIPFCNFFLVRVLGSLLTLAPFLDVVHTLWFYCSYIKLSYGKLCGIV
jgi:hypothetical protein